MRHHFIRARMKTVKNPQNRVSVLGRPKGMVGTRPLSERPQEAALSLPWEDTRNEILVPSKGGLTQQQESAF